MSALFSPALAAPMRPEYDDPFDSPACTSALYLLAVRDRPAMKLTCSLDVVHTGEGLDGRHGDGLARWTTEEGEDSFTEYLASQGPRCTECPRPALPGGVCGYHRGVELAGDDIETSEEAA